jgi:sterol desaturase/sphingolipid hydroxylase (fatty acid hydroxylase superfamily)
VHISQNLLQLAEWAKAPILAAVIFIPLERFWPWRRQRILRRGWKADLAYVSVNGLFVWLGITALLLAVTAAQRFWLPTGTATFFSKQPLWVQTVEALLVGDFCLYWAHRALHRSSLLWRFHAIHHSIEELDWAAAYHSHPIDAVILKGAALGSVWALGFSPVAIGIYIGIYGWVSFVVHANVRVSPGPLRWIVSSPAFHHWHHSNEPEGRDRNFAAIISLWDFIFRTAFLPAGRMPRVYGTDEGAPPAYADQLLQPFRKRRQTTPAMPRHADALREQAA